MQWEDDEEDEVQVSKATRILEEKRQNQGRPINGHQHRRKELPVYEDSFTKRLGRRSTSTIRERPLERNNTSSTTAPKTAEPPRILIDEIPRSCKY